MPAHALAPEEGPGRMELCTLGSLNPGSDPGIFICRVDAAAGEAVTDTQGTAAPRGCSLLGLSPFLPDV